MQPLKSVLMVQNAFLVHSAIFVEEQDVKCFSATLIQCPIVRIWIQDNFHLLVVEHNM